MRRSKLESCEAVLGALMRMPLNVDQIAYCTGMDCGNVVRSLDFLVKNGAVEERVFHQKTLYALTERGIAVFKTLNFQKYLQKVSTTLLVLDEAMKAVPIVSKSSPDFGK